MFKNWLKFLPFCVVVWLSKKYGEIINIKCESNNIKLYSSVDDLYIIDGKEVKRNEH